MLGRQKYRILQVWLQIGGRQLPPLLVSLPSFGFHQLPEGGGRRFGLGLGHRPERLLAALAAECALLAGRRKLGDAGHAPGLLPRSLLLLGAGLAMLEDGQVQAQRRAGGELPVSLRLLLHFPLSLGASASMASVGGLGEVAGLGALPRGRPGVVDAALGGGAAGARGPSPRVSAARTAPCLHQLLRAHCPTAPGLQIELRQVPLYHRHQIAVVLDGK
mmetsp:Transcript_59727/g.142497  ORF Transcript_59727/g.142497 Transcript_59727/m.142497 type:complete len:218 (+) Transcript_59727:1157-1810(+)